MSLLPRFVLHNYAKGQTSGTLETDVLFCELLGLHDYIGQSISSGNAPAATIKAELDELYAAITRIIYKRGGYIGGYTGNTFFAFFPPSNAVDTMSVSARIYAAVQTTMGSKGVKPRIGLAHDTLDWNLIPPEPYHWLFWGEAQAKALECSQKAEPGKIVLDQTLFKRIDQAQAKYHKLKLKPLEGEFYSVSSIIVSTGEDLPELPMPDQDLAKHFLPAFLQNPPKAALYDVLSIFAMFPLNDKVLADLQRVNAICQTHGAMLNKVGVTQGKAWALIALGIDNPRLPAFNTAGSLSLEIVKQIPAARCGAAFGQVFAGVTGGPRRSSYSVLGPSVNLAACLGKEALKMDAGTILLDEPVAKAMQDEYATEFYNRQACEGAPTFASIWRLTGAHPDETREIERAGRDAYEEGEYIQAVRHFYAALYKRQEKHNQDGTVRAYAWIALGLIGMRQYQKAASTLQKLFALPNAQAAQGLGMLALALLAASKDGLPQELLAYAPQADPVIIFEAAQEQAKNYDDTYILATILLSYSEYLLALGDKLAGTNHLRRAYEAANHTSAQHFAHRIEHLAALAGIEL